MINSWVEFGRRLEQARKDQRLTQQELAAAVQLDRTAVTKIEAGERRVDSLELTRLARALQRPMAWFLADPIPSVVSRRSAREVVRHEDVQLEALAQDVEQLIDLGLLVPPVLPEPGAVDSVRHAEEAADRARRMVGLAAAEPAWDLIALVERLGLYAFVLDLGETPLDGTYVALRRGGVALLDGRADSGRRRFTVAHELGHHVLADQYAAEWVVGSESEGEKIINAFAIHFLMPRPAVMKRWAALDADDPRDAAIRIAVEFGMSWSAACAQLQRFALITAAQFETLLRDPPSRLDLVERELKIRSDVDAPAVPPQYAAAVIRGLRRRKLGPSRALELLRGTLRQEDLPAERELPLEAVSAELEPLP